MFTIEHDFDATVITLIDEAEPNTRPLNEDVVIMNFDDRIVIEQMNPDGDEVVSVVLSMHQLTELRLALNLPEGNYRLESRKD
jgi:mitochondrial fission protein ELM1